MAYNGALLARAREKLAARREANEAERARRLADVYARSPRIKDIDRALRAQMVQLMGLAISHGEDVPARVAELERANLALQGARRAPGRPRPAGGLYGRDIRMPALPRHGRL